MYKKTFILSCLLIFEMGCISAQIPNFRKAEKSIHKQLKVQSKKSMNLHTSKLEHVNYSNLTEWVIDSSRIVMSIYEFNTVENLEKFFNRQLQKPNASPTPTDFELGDRHYLFTNEYTKGGMLLVQSGLFYFHVNTEDIDTGITLIKTFIKEIDKK